MNELNQQPQTAPNVGSHQQVDEPATATDHALCNIPKAQISVWNELFSDLNLIPETIDLDTEDADSLKLKALQLWETYDSFHAKCKEREASVAEVLYVLCKKLHAPGKKDDGFKAWLKSNGRSKATAYRWIRKYADSKGLELPFQPKEKTTPTLSHVGQGAPSPTSGKLNRYPVPYDIGSAKVLLHQFFEVAAPHLRSEWALELVDWIKNQFLNPDASSIEEL